MKEITENEVLKYLAEYGAAVHCSQYREYKWFYNSGTSAAKFYYDRGCVIVYDEYLDGKQPGFRYLIHHIAPDAEVDTVTEEWKKILLERTVNTENPRILLVVCCVSNGELLPEKEQYPGVRNYVRMGERVLFDSRVRILTKKDAELLYKTCKPYVEKDTFFGMQEAEIFIETDYILDNEWKTFGIFDGDRLVGIATSSYVKDLRLAWLIDLYVVPEYRAKGFGKALVLSALSEFPDEKWYYHTLRDNTESRALAKSIGFRLQGAELYVIR